MLYNFEKKKGEDNCHGKETEKSRTLHHTDMQVVHHCKEPSEITRYQIQGHRHFQGPEGGKGL